MHFIIAKMLLAAAGLSIAAEKPVQVYILAGQSNMVGIGQVTSGNTRWGAEFTDLVVSVYEGPHDPIADYDSMRPIKSVALESIGGVRPPRFPSGGTQVLRGMLQVKESGIYQFSPGFQASTYNVMEVNGQQVHRREIGGESTHQPIKLEGGIKVPFKVSYLTDQANGLGWTTRLDVPGTLTSLVHTDGKFPHLIDSNDAWNPRDDVWYRGVLTATANQWLNIGCGATSTQIGPELGFGHVIGDHHTDTPVLLIKASQGNRSLAWDFLPPGSERYEQNGRIYAGYGDSQPSWDATGPPPTPAQEGQWYAGKQYDDCINEVKRLLENFDVEFPQFAGRGHKIAGFVWWQGHKDQGDDVHAARYESNLVRLIHSLRKDFNAPSAPFTLATIGFGGWAMADRALIVANAQLAVCGESGNYPEFIGNVKTIESRDFWRPADVSPRDQDFHYNQNAETYMLVGESLGRAMVDLKSSAHAQALISQSESP